MDPINPIAGNPEALNQNPVQSIPKAPSNFPIILFSILTLILLGATGYLYYQNQQLKTMLASYQQAQVSPTPSSQSIVNSEYSKRHFSTNDKFFGDSVNYPQEILSFKDSDLVGFNCGPKYSRQIDGSLVAIQNNSPNQTLTDKSLTSLLDGNGAKLTTQSTDNPISSATICNTENNQKILNFEITQHGGGAGSDNFYGYLTPQYTVPNIANVPMESVAYFGCSDILAITKSNYLYAVCGGGDGPSGSKSIYKVNLNQNSTAMLLYKCTSAPSDLQATESAMNPVIKCGTTQ